MDNSSILFIFGTRPEAIKMAPLIKGLQLSEKFRVVVCVTAQHREMLDQVTNFFDIHAHYDLNLMEPNQSLFDITVKGLKLLENVLADCNPQVIFVQGDTTTAFIGALAGFYKKILVAHLEAGLRSGNKYSPFPEEINRVLVSHMCDFHFAPTIKAQRNLANEGLTKNCWVVGNTVIDALFLALNKIQQTQLNNEYEQRYSFLQNSQKKMILVTGHRRESFGEPFENICCALKTIAEKNPSVDIIYPVHYNPNVREPVHKLLAQIPNIHLIEPVDYPQLVWLLSHAYLVLTDSGGIQEEAPSLGKPVLVMRDVTERTEGIEAGTAKLVGTNTDVIVHEAEKLIHDSGAYTKMSKAINPYGDGKTAQRIVQILTDLVDHNFLSHESKL